MSKIYAIGDVHGCSRTLEAMLRTLAVNKDDSLYFLGDYIDRGPDSKGVVDRILNLQKEGYNVFTLRGNHEQLFIDSINGPSEQTLWERNGGDTTLESFGIDTYEELSEVYKDFFEETEHVFLTDDFVLVHAGLNFRVADPFSDRYAMLWIRGSKPDPSKIGGRVVIHGHTPSELDTILDQRVKNGSINLDAGCVYADIPGMGHLVAMELFSNKLFVEPCIDF